MNERILFFFWIEAVLLLGLSCFGLHRLWLMILFFRYRHHRPEPKALWQELPSVTVQLPIFNEPFVAERLLDAVGKLDYPRERFQVQVLDDSTDQTTQIIQRKVDQFTKQGLDISLLHRCHRRDFKAGALAEGLIQAKGDFIAIFDADFIPPSDFLKKTVHYFTDPSIGMIQTRWEHLNREDSYLTRAQALWLDAHFRIEQLVRSRGGYCFNFNGSAGVWRKEAILSAGSWQADTLTEDLDLSYRAQLAGWKGIYLDQIAVPGELPVDMNGLKSQQHRWTKGSIETAMKLLPRIFRSQFPFRQKLEACFHLGNWLHFLLAVLLILFAFPSIVVHQTLLLQNHHSTLYWIVTAESALGGFLILSTIAFYSLSRRGRMAWWRVAMDIPWLMAISIGLSLNNSRAIVEAVCGRRTGFVRTPKFAASPSTTFVKKSFYLLPAQRFWWSEVLIGLYISLIIVYACHHRLYGIIPFLIPAGVGFLYAGIGSLLPPTQET